MDERPYRLGAERGGAGAPRDRRAELRRQCVTVAIVLFTLLTAALVLAGKV